MSCISGRLALGKEENKQILRKTERKREVRKKIRIVGKKGGVSIVVLHSPIKSLFVCYSGIFSLSVCMVRIDTSYKQNNVLIQLRPQEAGSKVASWS